MAFNIDKFREHLKSHGDLAKPSKFEVEIYKGSEDTRGLSFQCTAAELPGYTVNVLESKIYGPSYHIASTPAYTDLSLTFICATDLWEKRFFEDWLYSIIPVGRTSRIGTAPHAAYKEDYISRIKIKQYTDTGDVSYTVIIEEAFPIAISPLTLDWSNGDGFHTLQVNFKYTRWLQDDGLPPERPAAPTYLDVDKTEDMIRRQMEEAVGQTPTQTPQETTPFDGPVGGWGVTPEMAMKQSAESQVEKNLAGMRNYYQNMAEKQASAAEATAAQTPPRNPAPTYLNPDMV